MGLDRRPDSNLFNYGAGGGGAGGAACCVTVPPTLSLYLHDNHAELAC